MYKVTKRDCPMFGIGPYVCEFICDTASDISTLPTSISEGTGGRTAYDNQKCASGSIANVAENGAESKQYMLNNQDIWCPYSVASGSSDSILEEAKAYTDSEIADLINGAPTTRDTLKEIADAMAENQTVVEALDAAIGSKANKTDIPTKVSQLENDSGFLTEHQDLSEYAKSIDVNAALGNKADISYTHDTYASKSLYSDTTINTGRKAGTTVGVNSTAEGTNTTSSSHSTHAEGIRTTASGGRAHAEGMSTTASGNDSHAEGCETTASGHQSHAEGYVATASGDVSHAEGWETTASGSKSHAEGYKTTASGIASHAGGTGTKALHNNEVAYGKYNESKDDTLFSVGDGTADDARHNAFEITKTGGMLHDKDILTSAHCIQFIPYNMKYYALDGRILLFSNDDDLARGIYFVNNTPNEITVCALISASAEGPAVQYGYGSNTYPEIQNTGNGRDWFTEEPIPTSPTRFVMAVPSGKLGYYGVYHNSETAYTSFHDIRCPYFNYF